MAGFSFDVSDFSRLSAHMSKIAADVVKKERILPKLAANEYKNDVQAIIPYKRGDLRRSVHVEDSTENGHPIALVGSDKVYTRQREYGGIITAKNAEYLHWVDDEGNDHFAKSVYQAPQPAWRPAWDHNQIKYERILKGVFDRDVWESDVAAINEASALRPDLITSTGETPLWSTTLYGMSGINQGTKYYKPYSGSSNGGEKLP